MSPQAALQPYLRLQSIATALKEAQPAAEDAAPHLVDHVGQTARTLWSQMKDAFASEFEETLKRMNWPRKDIDLTAVLELEWTAGVEKLLDLQEPYVLTGSFHLPKPVHSISKAYNLFEIVCIMMRNILTLPVPPTPSPLPGELSETNFLNKRAHGKRQSIWNNPKGRGTAHTTSSRGYA